MAKRPTTTSKTAAAKPKAAPRKPRSAESNVVTSEDGFPPILRDYMGRLNTKDTAFLLGVDDRTIRNWRDKEYCPAISSGGAVDMPRLKLWLEDRARAPLKREIEARDQSSTGISREEVELRGTLSDNLLKNLKYEQARGELVSKAEMHHHLSTILSDITMRLHKLGFQIGPDVSVERSAEKCTEIVNKKVDKILSELVVDIVMDMKRQEVDLFEESDILAAEAEAQALREVEHERTS